MCLGVRIALTPPYAQVMQRQYHPCLRNRVLRVRIPPCAPFTLSLCPGSARSLTKGPPPGMPEARKKRPASGLSPGRRLLVFVSRTLRALILILFKKAKSLFIAPEARSGSHGTV